MNKCNSFITKLLILKQVKINKFIIIHFQDRDIFEFFAFCEPDVEKRYILIKNLK